MRYREIKFWRGVEKDFFYIKLDVMGSSPICGASCISSVGRAPTQKVPFQFVPAIFIEPRIHSVCEVFFIHKGG